MKKTVAPLSSMWQTVGEMRRLVSMYSGDVAKYRRLSVKDFFDIVRKIPYTKDVPPVETVQRGMYTLSGDAADCKKKAVLMASFFEIKEIPWRFVVSSTRQDKKPHHVFTQFYNGKMWVNADATYERYKIGQQKKLTFYKVV